MSSPQLHVDQEGRARALGREVLPGAGAVAHLHHVIGHAGAGRRVLRAPADPDRRRRGGGGYGEMGGGTDHVEELGLVEHVGGVAAHVVDGIAVHHAEEVAVAREREAGLGVVVPAG